MSRTVTHALYKAAGVRYRAKLATNKYEEKLDAMGPKLRMDYQEVLYITRNRFYGWPWGPRVEPQPDPFVEQYMKDNERARVLQKEQAELEQRSSQLERMMQAVDDSSEVEDDFKGKLEKMVQATQELNTLLDSLEGPAELQGAESNALIDTDSPRPAPVSTSPAELETKKLPGGAESPTSTLQGVLPSSDSSTDNSSLRVGAWRTELNATGQEAATKVAESVETADQCPQIAEAGSWEIFCKAIEEGCAAISLQLRQALIGDEKEKQH